MIDLLEPHLWAALAFAVIAVTWLGYLFWRYVTGVAGDD